MRSPRPAHPAGSTPPDRPQWPARVCAVSAVLSAVLLALVATAWPPLLSFDESVARELHRWAVRQPTAVHVNRVLTDWVWDPWTMRALITAVCVWLALRREWLLALCVALSTLLGTLFQQGVKAAVDRQRPRWPDPVDSAHYAAFPSGHAMTATVVCGLLLWVAALHRVSARWMRAAAVLAAVSVIGVGLTRLYLGVHWPTDVLAGWLMGICWVLLTVLVYERVARRRPGRGAGAVVARTGRSPASPGPGSTAADEPEGPAGGTR
ncbi:phosphatase PAP2 family protein [Streptomyces clavuligerus]|nr:phosphatase PAP2 family protein [Streptomyces clavuligerus]WDN50624.1 phosphatase PAP2 family protein [Streptomyces clavuligerus]